MDCVGNKAIRMNMAASAGMNTFFIGRVLFQLQLMKPIYFVLEDYFVKLEIYLKF